MAKKERVLPDGDLSVDFIICDNTVNRYGWRLLVEGIDLTGFQKNPVALMQHYTYEIAIGRWENIRVENSKLLGTLIFDRNDEQAIRLYWKYKDGFMNAVSLHVIPKEESEAPEYLLPGQTSATVVKSELLEISVVTVPGQANAVKLSTPEGKEYKLNLITSKKMDKEEKTIEDIQKELDVQKKLNADNLVRLHKERGVVQDAEMESLKELALSNYDTVSKMLDAREKSLSAAEGNADEAKADALVQLHFDRGAITEPQKAVYKAAAKLDYDGTKKVLESLTGTKSIESFVQSMGTESKSKSDDKRLEWGYYDWFKKDPEGLALMEKNDPDKHKRLVADFTNESKKLGIRVEQEG